MNDSYQALARQSPNKAFYWYIIWNVNLDCATVTTELAYTGMYAGMSFSIAW